jgi:L-alanine-DL-glutamate epimerase-like enolase superfamily enzyme
MMTKLNWENVDLTLADPFEISYARVEKKTNTIVRFGEGTGGAAPSTTCDETTDTVLAALPQLASCLSDEVFDLVGFHRRAEKILPYNTAAKAAVDMALHDRAARQVGLPLYRFLGLPDPEGKESTISIGIDSVAGTLARMARFPGTRVFKIKVGYPGDVDRVEQIAATSKKRLRVDANGGWDFPTAVTNVQRLAEIGVELIEQPLPPELRGRLGELRRVSPVPIFVDEGCRTAADVAFYADRVDGVNVKLMKCGGIIPALNIVATARAFGLKLMIGCMIECAVSITAAAHLAGMFDYLDLDSHLLLTDDPYRGMVHRDGAIRLPKGPGTGVTGMDG